MKRAPLLLLAAGIAAAAIGYWLIGERRQPIAPPPTLPTAAGTAGETSLPDPVAAAPVSIPRERTEEPNPADPDLDSLPIEALQGPPGSIHGRVLDPAGNPAPQADIELVRGPAAAIQIQSLWTRLNLVVQSDESGVYRFPNVAPNEDYIVVVSHPEYGGAELGPVVVPPGVDKDAGDVRLREGVFIEGVVTCDSRPIANALIILSNGMERLRRLRPENPVAPDTEPLELRTVTDANGHYQFESAPFSAFEITAEADGFSRITRTSQTSFLGRSSREHKIDFALTPAARIAGQVVDERRNGIPGAKVLATVANQTFRCEIEAVSDAGGRFVIEPLALGDYFVQATCDGWSEAHVQQVAANKDDLVIEMRVQGSVAGIVVDEETGAAIPEFTLTFQQQAKGRGPIEQKRDLRFHDSGGRFEVGGLDPGSFVIEGSAVGYATSSSESFTVERGQRTGGIRVALNRGGTVTGRIVDRDGKPVRNALVSLRENGTQDNQVLEIFSQMGARGTGLPKMRTKDDGRFEIALIVPDTYQVAVKHNQFAQLTLDDVVIRKGERNDVGDLVVTRGARISGHAYDLDGKPLANATITAIAAKSAGYKAVRTDADGYYELGNLNPGNYSVTINSFQTNPPQNPLVGLAWAKNSRQMAEVADGDDVTIDLRLAKDKK